MADPEKDQEDKCKEMINRIDNKSYQVLSYLKKLRKYKDLLLSLSKRELKIKYTRTVIGLGWVFLQPLAAVVIYTVFFDNFIRLDTNEVPYTQFVFSGMVCWYIFTGFLSKGITSLLESVELINKVSFPRIILVISKLVPVLIEGCVLYLILLGTVIFNQGLGFMNFICSLFYFLQVSVFSLGIATMLSILVIKFRDMVHLVPFVIGLGIWLTPVFYPVSIVPAQYRNYIIYFNPVANAIQGIRNSLFDDKFIGFVPFLVFIGSILLLLISLVFFIKFERKIVERI